VMSKSPLLVLVLVLIILALRYLLCLPLTVVFAEIGSRAHVLTNATSDDGRKEILQ